jgi:hypothetical protein
MLGLIGMALDLSRVYNRKVELQNVAEATAIAAARKLDGTASGISAAMAAAESAATFFHYQYGVQRVSWSNAAITFSKSSDRGGNWVDEGTAAGTAAGMFFVKVDTSKLDSNPGRVDMVFMPVISSALAATQVGGSAVAGRTAIDVTPLAICAMSPLSADKRQNGGGNDELVEYGFRRGVSYDLMDLNPGGTTPANYVVNPIAGVGSAGAPGDTDPLVVGPYVCAGAIASPGLVGGTVPVASGFPLASLYMQLNSRFDKYDGNLCDFQGAPPDKNIKEYQLADIAWVKKTPLTGLTAVESKNYNNNNRLQTIADLAPPGGAAVDYGPLWVYAKAVRHASTEPPTGYVPFATTSWPTLYNTQAALSYPGSPPYKANNGSNFNAPSTAHMPGVPDRRVLNVPLLSCPVTGGAPATVLAIGKFFMTVPATQDKLRAEFVGAVPLAKVTGEVGLYP